MSFEEFLAAPAPPASAGPSLQAMWHDAHGDWTRAHACAQEEEGRAGAWVHAYLHRKEGDLANARYWYARAGRPAPAKAMNLDAEREAITRELLKT